MALLCEFVLSHSEKTPLKANLHSQSPRVKGGKMSNRVRTLIVIFCIALLFPVCVVEISHSVNWQDIGVLPVNGDAANSIKISLTADKTQLKPDDYVVFTFGADQPCYLTLMSMGSSGKIVRLWPNDYSGTDNSVAGGATRTFPSSGDGFRYKIAGPDGTERIIAYATSEQGKILTEQEFQKLGKSAFKQFKGKAKDLAVEFQNNSSHLPANIKWGTAQVNLEIKSQAEASTGINTGPPSSFQRPESETSSPSSTSNQFSSAAPTATSGQPDQSGEKLFILAIGASTGSLKYCEKDAVSITSAVKLRFGVPDSRIKTILSKDADYEGVIRGLKWLTDVTGPEDNTLIYFSGHGTSIPDQPPFDESDKMDECFVLYHKVPPIDYRTALRSKAIMMDDEFNTLVQKIPARKRIVIADACHSGTISKEIPKENSGLVAKYLPLIDPDTGKTIHNITAKGIPTDYGGRNEAVLSACLDNQSSYEDQNNQSGLFTYYLLQGIRSGSQNLQQAFERAKSETIKSTSESAQKTRGAVKQQTPQLTDLFGITKSMVFSK